VAISEFLLLRHLSGLHPLLFIIGGTIPPLVITLPPVITLAIIMNLIEFGSLATGKRGGRPMGGKESGFQVIGNIGDK